MTASLPQGYATHGLTLDQAQAFTDLVNLCSVSDIGIPIVSVDQLRSLWQLPGHDPGVDDVLITTSDGQVVGAGATFSLDPYTDVQCLGVVHPEHEGRGIGTWLLQRLEERAHCYVALAPHDAGVNLQTQTWSANERAARLFSERGYHLARVFQLMQIDFEPGVQIVAPAIPEGITIRTFVRGQDEGLAWLAIEESFADHWNHHEIPLETWTMLQIESSESFDPALWWLAFDGDEIAGAAICETSAPGQEGYGFVSSLGVRRPWRGRGIAKTLLLTAFAEYQRRGKQGVNLGVDSDSPTGANRLYERAGMRAITDSVVYAKELRAASA